MKIGFTGTRQGATVVQLANVNGLLAALSPGEVHHGNAIGADEQFASLAGGLRQVSHPCTMKSQQSTQTAPDEIRPPKVDPLARNRDIVDETDLLIACPAGESEELRSGTWATIRYARKQGKPLLICYPLGRVERERLTPGIEEKLDGSAG